MIALENTESEAKRIKHMAVCPEEWEDSFGDEFYRFSVDNDLYYAPHNEPLNTGEKSQPVEGQLKFHLMSGSEIMDTAEKLRIKVGENHD